MVHIFKIAHNSRSLNQVVGLTTLHSPPLLTVVLEPFQPQLLQLALSNFSQRYPNFDKCL